MAEGVVTGAEAVDLLEREARAMGVVVPLTGKRAIVIAGLDANPASIPFFLSHARRLLREKAAPEEVK